MGTQVSVAIHDHSVKYKRSAESRERRRLLEVVKKCCEESPALNFTDGELPVGSKPCVLFCHLSDVASADEKIRRLLAPEDGGIGGQVLFYTGARSASLRDLDPLIPLVELLKDTFKAGLNRWAKAASRGRTATRSGTRHE